MLAAMWHSTPVTQRQLPRWSDLAPLLGGPRAAGTARQRRVGRDVSIVDLRRRARRRTPRAVFDYVDGAADDEVSLARSRQLFRDLEFRPRVLTDVSAVDTATDILGVEAAYPFGFAPTGFTRMMHHEGERAVAKVARRVGIPYALATMGTTSPEDLAAVAPDADLWFQLYVWKDREVSMALVERARTCGFRTLILTVDLPVGGNRRRDVRNGLSIPPHVTARTIIDGALHPQWWMNLLTTEPLRFATLHTTGGTVADSADRLFDASLDLDALRWLRDHWEGPIIVKGIQTVEDTKRVLDAGADGVILSNHGGRQLDRSTIPLRVLGEARQALGPKVPIFIDGGILNGADIVAGVALGASACFVGRAYLYGLMAGGEDGVERAAQILTSEIERTMQLLGITKVSDLTPDLVRLP